MTISLLTVSVDYAPQLERSIARWRAGADDMLVVTAPRDQATQDLCGRHGVRFHATDRFWIPGAAFNKAGALAQGYGVLSPPDWVLIVDADVIPPENWRQIIEAEKPQQGLLHGARRRDEGGQVILDAAVVGFFMLFHRTDPRVGNPIFADWHNAGAYDSEFERRWGRSNQRMLPLTLDHQGPHGQNWCGVGNSQGMQEMWKQRFSKGWQSERLTHG